MNKDRGIIKWLPFQSLTPTKKVVNQILQEKAKVTKPIISLEQQEEIENLIMEAFYEQIEATITYYYQGYIVQETTSISQINQVSKKIILKNNHIILFNQILKIVL